MVEGFCRFAAYSAFQKAGGSNLSQDLWFMWVEREREREREGGREKERERERERAAPSVVDVRSLHRISS